MAWSRQDLVKNRGLFVAEEEELTRVVGRNRAELISSIYSDIHELLT
jgi:hypothetical protein